MSWLMKSYNRNYEIVSENIREYGGIIINL